MLHDDAVDLSQLGQISVERASHVEFADGNTEDFATHEDGVVRFFARGWYVQSAKTMVVLKDGFQTRAEALAWEKQHYSPSGAGWAELTGGK